MNLSKIYAIPGKSGLFNLVSQSRTSCIMESLEDKKRFPSFMTDRLSSLEEIAIYTNDEEVPLKEVFKNIYKKEDGKECLSPKSDAKKLTAYFAEILPDYDRERVYQSDIKKVFSWYNLLLKNNMIDLIEDEKESLAENPEEPKNE